MTKGSGLDVSAGYGQGLAVGDFDNDGRPDLFVAAYPSCKLFRNNTPSAAGSDPLLSTAAMNPPSRAESNHPVTVPSGTMLTIGA